MTAVPHYDPAAPLSVLVIGSGAAGLLFALHCAAQGKSVVLATKGTIDESNSAWAQGGVAAALDLEEDSPAAHLSDTLAAGAGLCDEAAAAIVAAEGAAARRRIDPARGRIRPRRPRRARSHARGRTQRRARRPRGRRDGPRHHRHAFAARAMRHPNVNVLERATAVELIVDDRGCRGAWLHVYDRLVALCSRR